MRIGSYEGKERFMRKKIRVFLILFVVLIIGGCLPENKANTSMADDHTNSQATGKTRHEMIYVKGEGFESLEEMEEASEYCTSKKGK